MSSSRACPAQLATLVSVTTWEGCCCCALARAAADALDAGRVDDPLIADNGRVLEVVCCLPLLTSSFRARAFEPKDVAEVGEPKDIAEVGEPKDIAEAGLCFSILSDIFLEPAVPMAGTADLGRRLDRLCAVLPAPPDVVPCACAAVATAVLGFFFLVFG
jgi:hypothetical protein